MKKEIKFILTDNFINKCECGETITMERYCMVSEAGKIHYGKDLFIGYCKCGTIFFAPKEDDIKNFD